MVTIFDRRSRVDFRRKSYCRDTSKERKLMSVLCVLFLKLLSSYYFRSENNIRLRSVDAKLIRHRHAADGVSSLEREKHTS